MKTITKQKLEAIIRTDIENMPYKFRDLHYMFFNGITSYKELSEEEINHTFREYGMDITEEDKEWATFNK